MMESLRSAYFTYDLITALCVPDGVTTLTVHSHG